MIEMSTYHSFFLKILESYGYLLNKNYPFPEATSESTVRYVAGTLNGEEGLCRWSESKIVRFLEGHLHYQLCLMLGAVEKRFQDGKLPHSIQWLSDNEAKSLQGW